MITKESLMWWADELNEEVLRLKNVNDYIKRIYYLEHRISSEVEEDLGDRLDYEIHTRMDTIQFIQNMIAVADGLRLTPIRSLSIADPRLAEDIQTEINTILDTESFSAYKP